MVHRCYVIWGYSNWILYPFAFVVLAADTTGLVLGAISTVAYHNQDEALNTKIQNISYVLVILTAIYVSLLTLLTAGRIWWTVRQVGQITGSRVYTKYRILLATILESGFLFSATQVVGIVFELTTDPDNTGLLPFNFSVISTQMAAIAPTVIIVRIAYGQAVESVQQMVSTLQFVEGINNSQQHPSVAHVTVNLRQSLAGVEERGTLGRIEIDQQPSDSAGDAYGHGSVLLRREYIDESSSLCSADFWALSCLNQKPPSSHGTVLNINTRKSIQDTYTTGKKIGWGDHSFLFDGRKVNKSTQTVEYGGVKTCQQRASSDRASFEPFSTCLYLEKRKTTYIQVLARRTSFTVFRADEGSYLKTRPKTFGIVPMKSFPSHLWSGFKT
ncbi:hypothetical protein PM082_004520 [Marasmius tenuissimus]|nr:hypothetical protein PM082_004520 [Marasmius tenuissimus]